MSDDACIAVDYKLERYNERLTMRRMSDETADYFDSGRTESTMTPLLLDVAK